jgi:autotransporter-associated beta strand protein
MVMMISGIKPASAAPFYWDPSATNTTAGSGSGVWSTSTANWYDTSSHVAWINGTSNNAYFQGADGTYAITVAEDLTLLNLNFNNSGYTLGASSAQTIALNGNITVASGKTATVGSNVTISRAANFSISGGGTLNLGVSGGSSTGAKLLDTQLASPVTAYTLSISGGSKVIVNNGGTLAGATSSSSTTPYGSAIVVGGDSAGGALQVESGGVVSVGSNNQLIIGSSTNSGTLTINGGQVNGATAVSGSSAQQNTLGLRFGSSNAASTSGTRTVNLNGGTLTVGQVFVYAAGTGGTDTFNFNGGTLRANASTASLSFIYGLTHAYVKSGGAIIDTNGFDINITQALEHDVGLGSTMDGGLIKNGAGRLVLKSISTFTGSTIVNAGSLETSTTGTFGAGNVTVASGAALVIGNSASIADSANLVFSNTLGTTINLNFSGTETVNTLSSISGQFVATGTDYDAATLNHLFGDVAVFTGSGLLTVSSTASIPEPSTYALLFTGATLVVAVIRRRKSHARRI